MVLKAYFSNIYTVTTYYCMSSFICVGKKLRKAHNKGVIKYKNGNSLTRQIVVFSKPIAK